MTTPSGASNRQRARAAEEARRTEETQAPRRLGHLPPAQAEEARALMDAVLLGAIGDPDESDEEEQDEG